MFEAKEAACVSKTDASSIASETNDVGASKDLVAAGPSPRIGSRKTGASERTSMDGVIGCITVDTIDVANSSCTGGDNTSTVPVFSAGASTFVLAPSSLSASKAEILDAPTAAPLNVVEIGKYDIDASFLSNSAKKSSTD